ncbi:hypothetical protein RJT34_16189 [Clitoria ternatea]|uniref:Uncharacterized protein n=1 Tax=Clitoria ternatea TaxID=43366 RepID=A0AAN9J893_CLITE
MIERGPWRGWQCSNAWLLECNLNEHVDGHERGMVNGGPLDQRMNAITQSTNAHLLEFIMHQGTGDRHNHAPIQRLYA